MVWLFKGLRLDLKRVSKILVCEFVRIMKLSVGHVNSIFGVSSLLLFVVLSIVLFLLLAAVTSILLLEPGGVD